MISRSSTQRRFGPDGRLELPEVTLVAASSVALEATQRALAACMSQVRFGAALLLCDRCPDGLLGLDLELRPIAPLQSRDDYSHFMLSHLADHVNTAYALCVQWDGYILDARAWNDAFFDFDYIGAIWPHFNDGLNVGNGGFSLRSRRLLQASQTLRRYDGQAEDVVICRLERQRLEREFGIRFAPAEIARAFAFERAERSGNEFGFHGIFRLMQMLPAADFRRLLETLEPGVLGRHEGNEIIRWALARGRLRIAHLARQKMRIS